MHSNYLHFRANISLSIVQYQITWICIEAKMMKNISIRFQ